MQFNFPQSFDQVADAIRHTEGVYFNIVNVSNQNQTPILKHSIPYDQDVLFLDADLRLLNPSLWYLRLLKTINVPETSCIASIDGLSRHKRANGKYTFFPIITGGPYNPYQKIRSNRSSASRRMRTVDNLSCLVNQKVFAMDFVLTFPKEISELLFDDPNANERVRQVHDLFIKRLPNEKGIFSLDNSQYKNTKGLQLGLYSNLHQWSSSNPFKPHFHFHTQIYNFLFDKKKNKFVRIQPYFSENQLKQIQRVWYECQKEVFGYGSEKSSVYSDFDFDCTKIDIHYKYKPGYRHGVDLPKQPKDMFSATSIKKYKDDIQYYKKNLRSKSILLHSLKYATRSWLLDVGNYFNFHDTDNDDVRFSIYFPFLKKAFKKFVNLGCIRNKTSARGYIRNLKSISRKLDTRNNTNNFYKLFTKKEKLTLVCPVTGEDIPRRGRNSNYFQGVSEIVVYQAHKSKMYELGVFKIKERSENA